MRRSINTVCLAVLMLVSTGCATLIAPPDPWSPLEQAFTAPIEDLERGARTGDQAAQYSTAFLAAYGLRGVEQHRGRALTRRLEAGQPRSTTIMLYVPGVNGAPGRTMPQTVHLRGLDYDQIDAMDVCGLALLENRAAVGRIVCTDPVWDRLEPLARETGKAFRVGQAAADNAASTPLP
jgi:hypothetical protein